MKRRWRYAFAIILVVPLLGGVLIDSTTLTVLLTVKQPLVISDAMVLLAGATGERAPVAAKLYHDGFAPLIFISNDGVFSSWSQQHLRNLYNVEWAEERLVQLGVPRTALVKLPFLGSGTIYEALSVKRTLSGTGINRLLVVTSDYHTRRALWTFRRVLKSVPIEARVFPAESSHVGRKCLTLELLKLAYYRVRFGLISL